MPLDLALVVSDSSLLKPPPLGRWGNDAAWPYARYFDFVFLPCRLQNQDASAFGGVLAEVCRDRREEDYFRYATQTCFNPVYSPLKLSVIELLDWLSSVERHRLAVLMTPGDNANRGFQVLRGLSFPTGVRSPVQWSTWSDANMQISDEACLYFSDIEVSPDTPYALSAFDPSILGFTPVTTQNVPDVDSCEKFNPGFPSGSGYHFPLGNVQQCFISNFLSLRDALYHHAARNSSQDLRAGALISALRGAYGELVREDAVGAVRGNLAGRANRIIVAISERLPPANDSQYQELLAQLEAQRISVLFVTYLHPNMANFDGLVAEATARKSALDALNSEQLYVQLAFDAATLRRVLRERVSMFKREVVIRS